MQLKSKLASALIHTHIDDFFLIFQVYSKNNLINIKESSLVLNEIFTAMSLTLEISEIEKFQRISYIYFPARKISDYFFKLLDEDHLEELEKLRINYKVYYPKISLAELCMIFDIVLLELYPEFKSQQRLIKKNMQIYKEFADNAANKKNNLNTDINKYNSLQKIESNQSYEISLFEKKMINNIYSTYNSPFSLKEFLKFLLDYDIIGNPLYQYRFILKNQAKQIYTHICLNSMSFLQFTVNAN